MNHATNLFRLNGKVALVTGGAGIVGRPIVRALAEAGATVVVASRDKEQCQAFADELATEGLNVEGEAVDLASQSTIRRLCDHILKHYSRLDVLVNNAVARAGGNLDDMTVEQWEATMKVNSTGLFLACKIFAEPMRTQRAGSIVNIASIYGVVGPHFHIYESTSLTMPVNYAFAKGGIISVTRYLASFLAPYNIRVNCLSPGGFATEETTQDFETRYSKHTLLGRMAQEDDIKGPVLFLASDASRYITGQNIPVDGGWTAI
ncbi:MAG TPA: SDR family oxidoreductase [Acidobacteriota bacterium]|jgi:NAD(P)-dependent dehydrogenase (short-subunit alcohol dehydrogenase family)